MALMSKSPSWSLALLGGQTLPILCIVATSLAINADVPAGQLHLSSWMQQDPASQQSLGTHSGVQMVQKSLKWDVSEAGRYFFLVGIPISICGATLTVLGLMVQKSSHGPMVDDDPQEDKSLFGYCCNCRWIGGLLLLLAGNAITWVALGLAPNSVLCCFNSFNIILTMVIAPTWFGEVVSPRTKWCAGALVIGCCWVAVTGPRSYRLQTVDHINELFGFPAFKVCAVCIATFFLASLVRYLHVRTKKDWEPTTVWQILSMSSISASCAVMFSKCTSALVQASVVTQQSQMKDQFFMYLAFSLVCGLSQLHFVNEGLKHAEASFCIPIYESMSMALQIVVGGMLFQEYHSFSWGQHLSFWPGVCMVVCGVFFLVKFADNDRVSSGKGGNPQDPFLIESYPAVHDHEVSF